MFSQFVFDIYSQLLTGVNWSLVYLLHMCECWVIKFYISCGWNIMKIILLIVKQVCCYFTSSALATQNSFTYTIRSQFGLLTSRVVWSIYLLIKRLKNTYFILILIFNHIYSRSPFIGQSRYITRVYSLNRLLDKICYFFVSFVKKFVGIDNSFAALLNFISSLNQYD